MFQIILNKVKICFATKIVFMQMKKKYDFLDLDRKESSFMREKLGTHTCFISKNVYI